MLQDEPVLWEPECCSDKLEPWCVAVPRTPRRHSRRGNVAAAAQLTTERRAVVASPLAPSQLLRRRRAVRAVHLLLLRRPCSGVVSKGVLVFSYYPRRGPGRWCTPLTPQTG